MIEDAGRIWILVVRHRRPPAAEFRRSCLAENWHCVPLSSSTVKLNFHRTFPTRYSWLGICPLFSFIIDWFWFGARSALVFPRKVILLYRHSFTFTHWYHRAQTGEKLYRLTRFHLFGISLAAPLSTGCLCWLPYIHHLQTQIIYHNDSMGFLMWTWDGFWVFSPGVIDTLICNAFSCGQSAAISLACLTQNLIRFDVVNHLIEQ